MEELSVYTYKDVDSLKFDVEDTFNEKLSFVDCSSLDFKDFKQAHQISLLEDLRVYCFYEISYSQEVLLEFLDYIEKKVIWCFKSLPKNRKLYKELNKTCVIRDSVSLSSNKDKLSFIKRLCKEHNIPKEYINVLEVNTSNSKFNIKNEIIKLKTGLSGGSNNILDIISSTDSESDLFNLCINLLSDRQTAVSYYVKMVNSKTPVNYIYSMLIKRLFYYLYLSVDNTSEAKQYWRGSDYYIKSDQAISKKYGFEEILRLIKSLTLSVQDIFGDSEYNYTNLNDFLANLSKDTI
jgi:hypothetical protein